MAELLSPIMSWIKNFWVFLVWFGIILYLSFTPLTGWPKLGMFEKLYFDKLVHIAMYGIMCFLLLRSFFKQSHNIKPSSLIITGAILFCAGVGITIEYLQPILTLYRQFEVADMIADAIGAVAGVYLFSWLLKKSWLGLKES